MKSHGGALPSNSGSRSGGQLGKSRKCKSKRGSNGLTPQTPSSTLSQGSNNGEKSRTFLFFICYDPHKYTECLPKKALNTMKFQKGAQGSNKGNEDNSKEEDQDYARINAIRFLKPQE